MHDIVDVVVAFACGAIIESVLLKRRMKREAAKAVAEEPTCTGYRCFIVRDGKKSDQYFSMVDCRALRSPLCMDGRCTTHCREMCKCDAPKGKP